MLTEKQSGFMRLAIEQSRIGMEQGHGGPFGCVIVKDGEVLVATHNKVLSKNDPTAHAEIVAIREACQILDDFQLTGCEIYASCEPCPMCMGAIYWARPDRVFFAANRSDAADAGFDDSFIYEELELEYPDRKIPFVHCLTPAAGEVFQEWKMKEDKTRY
ncbi:nucleoside deaminase [Flavihumibacter stibioxidans]|uniref:tRNA-specific adenosine deaminase n=1 Tax=Flavihumibacter stibioxidans TaxID=1834163 RepID=A0ABR7MDS9_9BACT|nr:nucleoside deaminase [Flavihumibacter stibioxidans]MBC6493102.1 tRNA-specific adenosine deaminase [Flavihumibacter stibioxidans]